MQCEVVFLGLEDFILKNYHNKFQQVNQPIMIKSKG